VYKFKIFILTLRHTEHRNSASSLPQLRHFEEVGAGGAGAGAVDCGGGSIPVKQNHTERKTKNNEELVIHVSKRSYL